ncbi:hypothetical protein PRIPAC_89408, partial [Pristionchus pacificus]|uniref:Uncharacterized protein n=1 Tax=Pristionchus pacificus TaxID=54126 RepID=A0A2A6B7E4_PRIPA
MQKKRMQSEVEFEIRVIVSSFCTLSRLSDRTISWVPLTLHIPDFILAPSFGYLLFVLSATNDHSLRTPFSTFFKRFSKVLKTVGTLIFHVEPWLAPDDITSISTQTASYSNEPAGPLTWRGFRTSFLKNKNIFELINQSAMMAATLGKFFIALHRYFVLRTVAVNEKAWSVNLVRCLIFLQLSVPALITGICFSRGYVVQAVANGTVLYNVAAQGQIKNIDQKNMFIVLAVCSLSHILKAGQQSLLVIYSVNGKIVRSVYETLLWPTFVVTNGLATYAPPLILIYCSSKIRRLLLGPFTGVGRVVYSDQTANATLIFALASCVPITA